MRIITGSARGCKLKVPKGMATRPTADRIKESLFNILGTTVRDARVLDLFAGTGSLGLEALSRGAAAAVFIDQRTARLIAENAGHAHLVGRAEILAGDAFRQMERLAAARRQFDLVFCDPPYARGLWQRALALLDSAALLAPDALVVVESGRGEPDVPPMGHLPLVREQSYGAATQIRIYKYRESTGGTA